MKFSDSRDFFEITGNRDDGYTLKHENGISHFSKIREVLHHLVICKYVHDFRVSEQTFMRLGDMLKEHENN